MLKNAVEELEKLKEAIEKNLKLNIKFAKGNDFLQIKIENTIEKNHLFKGINTPTTKKDKSNHGIGLQSINHALEKEKGKLTIINMDNTVCADVIIPIK